MGAHLFSSVNKSAGKVGTDPLREDTNTVVTHACANRQKQIGSRCTTSQSGSRLPFLLPSLHAGLTRGPLCVAWTLQHVVTVSFKTSSFQAVWNNTNQFMFDRTVPVSSVLPSFHFHLRPDPPIGEFSSYSCSERLLAVNTSGGSFSFIRFVFYIVFWWV